MNAVEPQEKVACRFDSYPANPEYVLLGKNVDPEISWVLQKPTDQDPRGLYMQHVLPLKLFQLSNWKRDYSNNLS